MEHNAMHPTSGNCNCTAGICCCKKHWLWLILLLMAGSISGYYFARMRVPSLSSQQIELKQSMRRLWSDHVFWTREYILTVLNDNPQLPATTERLLKNQEDLGKSIAPYYGEKAGIQLAQLLKEHILIAADLITAVKSGDKIKIAEIDKKWHLNAIEIAQFLSKINSSWSRKNLIEMLNDHLALTRYEMTSYLEKHWQENIHNFDSIFKQALVMADEFTAGIIKQFPQKF